MTTRLFDRWPGTGPTGEGQTSALPEAARRRKVMQDEERTVANRQFRFSLRQVEALPPQDRDAVSPVAEYSDTEVIGLKLAVSKNGRKYFWHRYRFRNRKRMIKLGEYPSVSIVEARRMANENKNLLARDLDPADERDRRRSLPTLAEFSDQEYLP